jgi:AcrR family transcriptional regulator
MIKSNDQETAQKATKPVGEGRRPRQRRSVQRSGPPQAPQRSEDRPRRRRQRRNEAGERMRTRIVEAALETVRAEGYAGTSVRSIAATGRFSPALVFYHFGSVDALLLAVLDRVSADRLARYQARLEDVSSLLELSVALEELYLEDLELGQLTAVQEIVAAMAFDPQLGPEIVARMQPWMSFAEQLAARLIAGSALTGFIDPAVVGSGVIALYLGQEIVARMRGGDTSGSRALVATLREAAPWIDQLLGKCPRSARRAATRVELE